MTRNQPAQAHRVTPIDPAWRSTIFGSCDGLNDRQYRIGQRQFAAMKHAFRFNGGFMDTDEIALRLRCCCDQPVSRLARWIVSRSVVCISWEAQTLMPGFQFARANMSIRPCCAAILDELRDLMDNWELGLWFAAPNAHLDYAAPVALLAREGAEVLRAARRERLLDRCHL